MPKHDLSNAMKSMGARAHQRLQLDEPAPAPVALTTVPPPAHDSESDRESELEVVAPAPSGVQEPHSVSLSAMVPSAEPKRRGKKELAQLTPAKHMGTIEMPYVRQRDNTPTRKVSAILPVDLARELQVHCVLTGQRTNTFIEEALRVALAQAKSRRAGR